ncbi:MAG: methionyl-tRNA formyltransferase, partial [Leptonema sp. (in: Bacteria)]|nr:methionyl-tRNA formyltransferase [Leptonema sp. (in: bacteria)]
MLRLIYFGSPDISAQLLKSLIADPQFQVCAVVSNPDRPKGRSNQPIPTPVASLAIESNIALFCYPSLQGKAQNQLRTDLAKFDADLAVVFAYGSIIPESIFNLPRLGSVNLHGSLLPLLRGASPIQSAILAGFSTTGWTLQKLAKRMDAGDIVSTVEIDIQPNETADQLLERMLPLGIQLVSDSLKKIDQLLLKSISQDESKATYCTKIHAEDSWIDWQADSIEIHNRIRAFNSAPSARSINFANQCLFL